MSGGFISFLSKGSLSRVQKLRILKVSITVVIGFVLTMTLLVQMGKILERYAMGPTYLSTVIVHQKNANFPAITICPNKVQYNSSRLREHGFASSRDYNDARKGRNISWSSNGTLSNWELFEYLTVSSGELIQTITIKLANESIIALNGSSTLTAQGHRKFGRCWTFYPESGIRNMGINSVRMIFKDPVKLYIHRKGQFLDLSGRMGYKVYLGERHYTQINYQDLKMLEKEKKEGFFYCKRIEYDDCMYGTLSEIMVNETGCIAPWIMDKSKKICEEHLNINKTFWIAWNRITNQENDCPNPCDFLRIQTGDKNFEVSGSNDTCTSTYYFSSKVTLNEEHYLYSGLSLFAEIGGYLGLLLGLSFFHIADIFGKCFDKQIQRLEERHVKKTSPIK